MLPVEAEGVELSVNQGLQQTEQGDGKTDGSKNSLARQTGISIVSKLQTVPVGDEERQRTLRLHITPQTSFTVLRSVAQPSPRPGQETHGCDFRLQSSSKEVGTGLKMLDKSYTHPAVGSILLVKGGGEDVPQLLLLGHVIHQLPRPAPSGSNGFRRFPTERTLRSLPSISRLYSS